MASLLFVHNNFPAQLGLIASAMAARGHDCRALSSVTGRELAGIPLVRWGGIRGSTPGIFAPAVRAEADFIRGSAAAQAALGLGESGFTPDVIVGHPGWGETIFLGEVFPKARQVAYAEYYYRAHGGDVGFDPEFKAPSLDEKFRVHAKNATMAMVFGEADRIVAPTPFQAGLLPVAFRNRRFEPLRGYHVFMRALPRVLAQVPEAGILIGSERQGGYGLPPPKGATWKQLFLDEVKDRIDPSRIHFTGPLPHGEMLAALSLSRAHVYYTIPSCSPGRSSRRRRASAW